MAAEVRERGHCALFVVSVEFSCYMKAHINYSINSVLWLI